MFISYKRSVWLLSCITEHFDYYRLSRYITVSSLQLSTSCPIISICYGSVNVLSLLAPVIVSNILIKTMDELTLASWWCKCWSNSKTILKWFNQLCTFSFNLIIKKHCFHLISVFSWNYLKERFEIFKRKAPYKYLLSLYITHSKLVALDYSLSFFGNIIIFVADTSS